MTSPELGDVVHQYSCRCRNITIDAYRISPVSTGSDPNYQRVLVGEDGIHIIHHYLTLRTRDRPQESKTSPNNLLQHLALSCLACKTTAYRVAQDIAPGSAARQGPVVPTEDWIEHETLRSKNGWIEVFVGTGGCLAGRDAIERHYSSLQFSGTFEIGILSHPETPRPPSSESSPLPQPRKRSPAIDAATSATPAQMLPSLPPLFPPPPFTSTHPVFLSLSARAIAKSIDLRQQVEDETRLFVNAKLDALEKEEAQLRKEVDCIWRGYREGWKEILDRVNNERRRSFSPKSEVTTAIPGIPMSIRDFSPIVRSHPSNYVTSSQSIPPSSTSLLSASLIHSGKHLPNSFQSPAPGTSMFEGSSSGLPTSTATLASSMNGRSSAGSSSSVSLAARDDVHFPSAFKRNMDANLDIASSMAWAQGEEEMRRRFGDGADVEPRERARKRTSKNLGIGEVKTRPARHSEESTHLVSRCSPQPDSKLEVQPSGNAVASVSQNNVEVDRSPPINQVQARHPATSDTTRHGKRRVTFDVQSEVAVVDRDNTNRRAEAVAEVELFDLDDLTSTGSLPESDLLRSSKSARDQPVIRTPSYKLRLNDGVSISQSSQPASLPAPRLIPHRPPVNGNLRWTGGNPKKSMGLADALPLLSSSVPAGDRLYTNGSQDAFSRDLIHAWSSSQMPPSPSDAPTPSQPDMIPSAEDDWTPSPAPPSIPNADIEPAEAQLKHLLAASAPSHRHAWKEGGRAWQMFQRSRGITLTHAISEEGTQGISSSPDGSDISSDNSLTNGTGSNPSYFATSLPVQIRPLARLTQYEPKTSVTDKQGILVPPLKVKSLRVNSATAIRKAIYAERDRTRSIDPGPTLDFNEQEDIEEEDDSDAIGQVDRGRRHAFSILQARSIIPEAGMWRSMAS